MRQKARRLMANCGSATIKMNGLWNESAFQDMFTKPWAEIQEELAKNKEVYTYVSSRRIAKALLNYANRDMVCKMFKPEYLCGGVSEHFIQCVIRTTDEITTLCSYTYDRLVPYALGALFPKKEVSGEWFIDGLNEFGSFTWKGWKLTESERKYVE
jgi:hypothetical protein